MDYPMGIQQLDLLNAQPGADRKDYFIETGPHPFSDTQIVCQSRHELL